MKLKHFAPLLLIAPLALLSACGGGVMGLTFASNWYADSTHDSPTHDTHERLVYEVDFAAPASQKKEDFRVEYDKGVYTTELATVLLTPDLGEGVTETKAGYKFTTSLSITGRYYVNNTAGSDFTDVVKTEVYFYDVTESLRPVKSVREVTTYAPNANAEDASHAYTQYKYKMTTVYNAKLTQATVEYDDLTPKNDDYSQKVSIKGGGTYLDDAQLVFALRGTSLASTLSFRSLNPVRNNGWSKATVSTNGKPVLDTYRATEKTASGDDLGRRFSINGEAIDREAIPAYSFSLVYGGTYAGGAQSFMYAAKLEGANIYRNVLLWKSEPLPHGLGTLTSTLKEANFA